VVVNVFSYLYNSGSQPGNQIQTYDFVWAALKVFTTNQLTRFVLLRWRSLLHKILEVLLKDTAYRKESFPRKDTDTKVLQNMCFAYFSPTK